MADEENVEEEENSEDSSEQEKKAPGKSNTMIVIGVGLLVIIATPLITFFVMKSVLPSPVEAESAEKPNADNKVILDLDPITVNVAETKGTRVMRLKAHLVLSEERLMEKIQEYEPMLLDRVMLAVSRRTIDELEGAENRELLKKDIMSEINASIKGKMSGAVIDVYFSEFLIQ